MIKIIFVSFAILVIACTKPNPNRCCTDEADCMAQGLPTDSQCSEGLLCRGGQCIAQMCSSATDCDASAPFCVDQSCTESCTADDQCPGFAGSANQQFCESGACVQCHSGSNADCGGTTPVCEAGACRACSTHSECASGVCTADGSCAIETDIAYVEPGASDLADCSKATKCSLAHGASLGKRYVLLSPGTFTLTATLLLSGTISLIGSTSTKPSITMTGTGPVLRVAAFGDVSVENLEVRGGPGAGVDCPASPTGTRKLQVIDVEVRQNTGTGIQAQACTVIASRSVFANNGINGLSVTDGSGTIDECYSLANGSDGFSLDLGVYTVRNSIAARNVGSGIIVNPTPGTLVEFCTSVDNMGGAIDCLSAGYSFPNNVLARNGSNSSQCTFPSSIISAGITGLNFKSPDVAPYDYHITAGSIAIDAAATASTNDHDFDGDARPQGAGRDVGADEFKP
jgi:hypothetical protein